MPPCVSLMCRCALLLLAAVFIAHAEEEEDVLSDARYFDIVIVAPPMEGALRRDQMIEFREPLEPDTTANIDLEDAPRTSLAPAVTTARTTTSSAAAAPSSAPKAPTAIAVAPGVVAVARGPPLQLGVPPANATTDYPVAAGFAVRVPAGAWLFVDARRAPRRDAATPQLTVTLLDLPLPFLAPSADAPRVLVLAVGTAAVALGPSGRRPRAPLLVRLPAAPALNATPSAPPTGYYYYQLLPDGSARRCDTAVVDGVAYGAVDPLGVVFVGEALLRLPDTPSAAPPSAPSAPPSGATTPALLLLPVVNGTSNSGASVIVASPQAAAVPRSLQIALGSVASGLCVWGVAAWRWRAAAGGTAEGGAAGGGAGAAGGCSGGAPSADIVFV